MRPSRNLLGISAALNVGLAVWLVALPWHPPPATSIAPSVSPPRPSLSPVPSTTALAATPTGPHPFSWRMIESADYPQYIANLRAVGCPEATIREILLPDIEKLYLNRWTKARQGSVRPLWVNDRHALRAEELEKSRQYLALQGEKRQVIRELLGVATDARGVHQWYNDEIGPVVFGYLPEGVGEQVASIGGYYKDLLDRVDLEAGGVLLPEDVLKKRRLFDDAMAEIRGIISAAELEEGTLRTAMIGYLFKSKSKDMAGFRMTGWEFRELMRLTVAYAPPWAEDLGWREHNSEEENHLAEEKIETEFRHLLGESRYRDYKRSMNEDYRSMIGITDRLHLSHEAAARGFDARQSAMESAARIRVSPDLSEEERTLALDALQGATARAMAQALGPTAWQAYMAENGQWFTNLTTGVKP